MMPFVALGQQGSIQADVTIYGPSLVDGRENSAADWRSRLQGLVYIQHPAWAAVAQLAR